MSSPTDGYQPAAGTPGPQPAYGQPAYGQPGYGQPAYGQPAQAPAHGTPGYPAPSYPQALYPPAPYPPGPYGYAPYPAMPSSNIGWAIGALLLFWPLCIPAFISSSKVSTLWFSGQFSQGLQASQDAKKWGRLGVIIGAGLTVLFVIIYVIIIIAAIHATGTD